MNNIIEKDIANIISRLDAHIEKFNNKNILLAGGGGFLGFYFTKFFQEIKRKKDINTKVTFIDNFVSSSKSFISNDTSSGSFEFINEDICSENILNLNHKFDYIIHAAGIASPFYYRQKPLETLEVSITGSKNLLNLSKRDQSKYIFFSSSEIYGDPLPEFVPMKETYRGNVATTGPRSCYDEGKRVGETLCYIYQNYHNVNTNIIRPFNIYGPGMQKNDYRVMSNFANNFLNNKPLKVYGKGSQTRTFCYISDGIEGFLRVILLGKEGEHYNIGNASPEISMIDLAKLFFDTFNKSHDIEIVDYPSSYPEDEPNRRCPDTSKASDHLDFNSQISLEEGIKNYISWCQKEFT